MAALLTVNSKTVRGSSGLLREDHLCIWPGQQKISHQETTDSEFGRHCDMMKHGKRMSYINKIWREVSGALKSQYVLEKKYW